MPWCPKCKNEYKEGVLVCTDCGTELVEKENSGLIPVLFGKEEEMTLLKDFLVYSKIDSACIRESDEEGFFELLVDEAEEKTAKKLAMMFIQQKTMERMENNAEETPEENKPGVYEDSAQKAEDNKSSAITLLGVGILGMAFIVLAATDVIPLNLSLSSAYMIYGVMSALFILFIVMGVVSMRSSKIFAKKAESENSLRSTIEEWCLTNLDAKELDSKIFGGNADSVPDEMKYFSRAAALKQIISNQFLNLDAQFLDYFVDEIYGDIFENED